MIIQGAAGDISPFWHKTPIAEGAFEQMEQMGEAVAREVVRVRSDITGYEETLWTSLYQEVLPVATRWDVDEPEVRESIRAAAEGGYGARHVDDRRVGCWRAFHHGCAHKSVLPSR